MKLNLRTRAWVTAQIVWFSALPLGACRSDSEARDARPEARADTALVARVVHTDSLAAPIDVAWVRDRLVVLDPMADSVVKVIDPASGRLEHSFGRRGKGPGEFAGAWSLQVPEPGSGEFWIYDFELRRLTHVDLDKYFRDGATRGKRLVHLRADFVANSPVHLRDGSIISPGFMAKPGRLARFDSTGSLLETVGSSPPGREGVPSQVAQRAYQSVAGTNADRDLVVLGTRHSDRLEIYRPDGTLVTVARGPARFEPVYDVAVTGGHPSIATGEDLRFGYVGLATTTDRIYALYSGKTRAEAPGRASFGSAIHLFDWTGRLLRTLTLDSSILGIAVDPAGRTVYGLRHDPEPAVVAYTIPEESTK